MAAKLIVAALALVVAIIVAPQLANIGLSGNQGAQL
jgi:hypothetical protein